jgi:UMF1 family MFS transporter
MRKSAHEWGTLVFTNFEEDWDAGGEYVIARGPLLGEFMGTFVLLRERAVPQAARAQHMGTRGEPASGGSLSALMQSWRTASQYRDFAWLLACGACYQAGISVVVALAAVYAEQALGFKQADTMMLIFLVNIAAAAGAFSFGYWQDRIGHKPALAATLVGWIVMTVMAVAATGPGLFWFAAVIAGLCMGSSQSAGRAMAAQFSPLERRAEFFGLWTFAARASAVLGLLTYGAVVWLTDGNQRMAMAVTGLFFVGGLVLLARVDIARGQRAAQGEVVA